MCGGSGGDDGSGRSGVHPVKSGKHQSEPLLPLDTCVLHYHHNLAVLIHLIKEMAVSRWILQNAESRRYGKRGTNIDIILMA